MVAIAISFVTLGPGWLKARLVEIAREKLDARLEIGSLTFSPFTGRAVLGDVRFERLSDSSEVRATVQTVCLDVRVWPLLRRSVRIERLEALEPRIAWLVRQPPDAERTSAYGKLARLLAGADRVRNSRADVSVDELILRGGSVEFVSETEGSPPFLARATGVQYRARGVSLKSFGGLAKGADIDATIEFGGTPAVLIKRGSENPATFSLTGVDLARADAFFDQSDALVIAGGTLDFRYALGGERRFQVRAEFRDLRLGENPGASSQTFAFVPIGTLRRLVDARGGNLNLEFSLDDPGAASEDLRVLLSEVWTGMWTELAKALTSGALKDALGRGADLLLDKLKPGEK